MTKYVFGIDLGGTTVKLGLFSTDGELLDKWEIPTRTENGGEHILPDISASMSEKLRQRGISLSDVTGAGIGVPGAVLDDSVVKPCVNLNGWGGNIAEKLSALCGLPVKVVNDANAAALGEMWLGGGKGFENVVFVTLGTGVGGGIILGGKLLSGFHGCGGELGHMKIYEDAPTACGCGKRGCLEQFASATGIANTAKRLLAETDTPSPLRELETVTAKDVLDAAKAGDPLSCHAAEVFGDALGRALASVSCVCDPEVFVLGGGVSKAGSYIIDLVRKAFVKYAFPPSEITEFALASLGNDAGICGAAKLALGK
ncbi:MAG: ROK family glucokinase [Oscillospiraceae bacterium]|nr:ROK family glucokinase [Oscillospiraceae bacterium]